MTDSPDRADALRRSRAEHAAATGAFQRRRSLWIAGTIAVIGAFMTLSSLLYFSGWGLAGGLCVLGGAALIGLADRHRVETVEAHDRPAHRAELARFVAGVALVALGLVLTIRPW